MTYFDELTTIKKEYDKLSNETKSKVSLDSFMIGWKAHENWYKNIYYDDGK